MANSILLVEDDLKITEIIMDYFQDKSNGEFQITHAADGDCGMELIYEHCYDLVLLDVMLPGCDGFALCRELRKDKDTPIIFITARGREEDRLYGYHLGCDDYVVKPFSLAELYMKVGALLRRSRGTSANSVLTAGGITMDLAKYRVTADGKEVLLAPKEYELLKFLMEHQNVVSTREEMLLKIWGYDYEGNERVLDNHMKKLRKALGSCGAQIKTVITRGYRLEA